LISTYRIGREHSRSILDRARWFCLKYYETWNRFFLVFSAPAPLRLGLISQRPAIAINPRNVGYNIFFSTHLSGWFGAKIHRINYLIELSPERALSLALISTRKYLQMENSHCPSDSSTIDARKKEKIKKRDLPSADGKIVVTWRVTGDEAAMRWRCYVHKDQTETGVSRVLKFHYRARWGQCTAAVHQARYFLPRFYLR